MLLKEQEDFLKRLLQSEWVQPTPKTYARLRISNVKGFPCYYSCHRDPETNQRTETYIKKDDLHIAKHLAQQEYDRKIRQIAARQLFLIQRFLKEYDETKLDNVFQNLHPARRALIQPRVPNWDLFLTEWYNAKPQATLNKAETGFETDHGELVRSKSEKIIADKYFKLGIPYQYEKPLTLLDGSRPITLHPDFTLLKKGDFREYYHEHFGMMDSPDYCRSVLKKISLYRNNGIYEGERLFITLESAQNPLNIKEFEALMRHHMIVPE